MNELSLPQWVLDTQRQVTETVYGRVQLELVVSHGRTAKAIGTKNTSVKVKANDEAFIYMIDHVRTLLNAEKDLATSEPKNGGTITFSITHKSGKISVVNTFETIEFNYPV
jgi:hypothetical protein